MKKFFKEFLTFIKRGNVLDMAVGVIVGSAFTAIVTALSNGILKPLINWVLRACRRRFQRARIGLHHFKSHLHRKRRGRKGFRPCELHLHRLGRVCKRDNQLYPYRFRRVLHS